MRLSQDSENISQQNIFIKNIKQIRDEISRKSAKRTEHLELYSSRINNHNLSLNGFLTEAESLKLRLQFMQQFKEIDSKDLNDLNKTINDIRNNLALYKIQLERLENGLQRLKELEQSSQLSTLILDLEQIRQDVSNIEDIYLKADEKLKIDQQQKSLNEISSNLKRFERKYSPSLADLKSREEVKLSDVISGLEWDMKFAKFKIGFVGNSGKAKSSLINRLRNLPDPKKNLKQPQQFSPEDEYDIAAPTGTGETTKFPIKYSWKNRPSILLKDFPGFGLTTTIEEYSDLYLKNDNCHIYIILYTERLTKTDIKLAKLIKTTLNRPVILARSKTDIDFENTIDDLLDKSEENVFRELKRRLNYEINQQEFDIDFDDSFPRQDLKIFLISCKQGNEDRFEMKDLIKEIFASLPDELGSSDNENKSNVLLTMSRDEIKHIRDKLEKRIVGLSTLSAVTDIVPIAGQIADLGILIGEVTRYRDYFCLKKEYIKELGKKYDIKEDRVTDIIKIVSVDAKYINIKNFVLSITGAVSIGVSVAQAITSAVSLGINIVTFGAGCFISAIISGPISYYLCRDVLKKALDQMEIDALQIIELIHLEIKDKEK